MSAVGTLAALAGACFWSIGPLYSRDAPQPPSQRLRTGMQLLAGGVLLYGLGGLTGEFGALDLTLVTPRSLFALAYLSFFGAVVAFIAFFYLLRTSTPPSPPLLPTSIR